MKNMSIALLTVCDPIHLQGNFIIYQLWGVGINMVGYTILSPSDKGFQSPTPTDEDSYEINFRGILWRYLFVWNYKGN